LLFEFVVTPVETVATMVGKGKQIETFNQSLGAADWEGALKRSDGYVETGDGVAFDPDVWERQHPGQKWDRNEDPHANGRGGY